MPKIIYGQNGVVVNIVSPAPSGPDWDTWIADDSYVVSVGDPFDPHDPQVDATSIAAMNVTYRHENLIRQLIRTVRSNATLNTAADANGLPTNANSQDLTKQQFRAAVKSILP